MVNVLVPVADGTEEMEAVTIIDVLVRAGAKVCVASVMPRSGLTVTASRGVKLTAECSINECGSDWDLIVLPGGLPGAEHLQNCGTLIELVKVQLANNKWLGAICASPAVALGRNNLISDRLATCYPGFQNELQSHGAQVSTEAVAFDGRLVTSQGPGTALAFALTLVECLFGAQTAQQVAEAMLVPFVSSPGLQGL